MGRSRNQWPRCLLKTHGLKRYIESSLLQAHRGTSLRSRSLGRPAGIIVIPQGYVGADSPSVSIDLTRCALQPLVKAYEKGSRESGRDATHLGRELIRKSIMPATWRFGVSDDQDPRSGLGRQGFLGKALIALSWR